VSQDWRYRTGAELPDAALEWFDADGVLIPFATGWTFELKVATRLGDTALFTKTSGITGADTAPNVVVVWATGAGELNALPVGSYVALLRARNAAGKDRYFKALPLIVEPAIA
jgi:hypothetical protein